MKILFDSAASMNLGDIGMMEGVVSHWCTAYSELEACVLDRVHEESFLWSDPHVHRIQSLDIAIYRSDALGFLEDVPFIWRLARKRKNLVLKSVIQRLGNQLRAANLPLEVRQGSHGPTTMGEMCAPFDALHLSGGGNFTSTFPFEMIRKCALVRCFQEQDKPVIVTGQQIGPFTDNDARQCVKGALSSLRLIGVREPVDSLSFAREVAGDSIPLAMMGDDSFGLPEADPVAVDMLLKGVHLSGQRFLALNLRVASYMSSTSQQMKHIVSFVRQLSQHTGLPILVVPIAMGEGDSDIASGRRLAEEVGDGIVRVLDDPGLNATLARGVLGRAVAGLGTSYHFCTFALSQGVTAICLYDGAYYTQKAKGLAAFWGDKRLLCSFEQLNEPGTLHGICSTLADQSLKQQLERRSREAIRIWEDYFALAVSRLRC